MAVRLFVGNMPYGATEADLRAHFSGVGAPSQVVIPVDRETGRPRGFAFVEFLDRAIAEEAINRFNQQPFMGRSLSVSEARPREAGGGGGGGFRPAQAAAAAGSAARGPPAAASAVRGRAAASAVHRRAAAGSGRRRRAPAPRRDELRSAQEEERLEREALGEQGTRPEGPNQGALHRPARRALRRPERRQRPADRLRRSRRARRTTTTK